ncbi:ectonucleoside triphosphate diphosphohydrolase 1 isoform X2 [Pogona vitticeps]
MDQPKGSKLRKCFRPKYIITGFLLTVAIIALITVAVTQNHRFSRNSKYGVVLDAGSSHTNLYIYKWPAEKENDTGVVEQVHACEVEGPGISSYAGAVEKAGVSLKHCMDWAKEIVPQAKHHETPVYLGATAGMRLLRMENAETAKRVLSAVEETLCLYPFKFQGARILSGKEEGAYGWITLNYLLGNFKENSSTGRIQDPCFQQRYERTINVSDLRINPCTASDFTPPSYSQIHIEGTGDYEKCLTSIEKIFNIVDCPYSSCSFNGTFLPEVTGQFGAFSAFYYVMNFLNITKEPLDTVVETMKAFCSKSWVEVKADFPKVKEKYLSEYCFAGTYIISLLVQRYNFTNEKWKNIKFLAKVHNSDAGWALGYMLNLTNMIPAEQPYIRPLSHASYVSLMAICSIMVVSLLFIGWVIYRKPKCLKKEII